MSVEASNGSIKMIKIQDIIRNPAKSIVGRLNKIKPLAIWFVRQTLNNVKINVPDDQIWV